MQQQSALDREMTGKRATPRGVSPSHKSPVLTDWYAQFAFPTLSGCTADFRLSLEMSELPWPISVLPAVLVGRKWGRPRSDSCSPLARPVDDGLTARSFLWGPLSTVRMSNARRDVMTSLFTLTLICFLDIKITMLAKNQNGGGGEKGGCGLSGGEGGGTVQCTMPL